MTKYLPKRVRKVGKKNPQRQKRTAKNMAKGMSPERAMVEAGYSPNYAASHAYKVVKKPYIQSIFTASLERVMKAQQKEFDAIVKPYVDALDAPLVVKSTMEGIACIAKDPETQEVIPDHDTRMRAADRLVDLYGGKAKAEDDGEGDTPRRKFIRIWEVNNVQNNLHVHVSNGNGSNGHGGNGHGANGGGIPPAQRAELAEANGRGGEASAAPVRPSATAGDGAEVQRTAESVEQSVHSSTKKSSDADVPRRIHRRKVLPNVPKRDDL